MKFLLSMVHTCRYLDVEWCPMWDVNTYLLIHISFDFEDDYYLLKNIDTTAIDAFNGADGQIFDSFLTCQ